MIEIKNVTKKYGKLVANENISMNVKDGEMAVLLGPNGAGKSTLIKSVCGLLRFDGSILIDGFENHTVQAKRLLGYVPEIPSMFGMLTVYEHLEFIAKAYKLENWKSLADELLARLELDDKAKKLGKELSKGMQQKVSICCALLHKPRAVIFDEPLVGLDPHAIRELKNLFEELKQSDSSLIVSTHMIETMEDNWDTTYIMQNGKVRASADKADHDSTSLESLYFSITEGGSN
ncbi:MAG: ABC transporter ATP-binding protein [Clostridiales bacterium]|nr:ABC transporter ATP-binding protein [Clostridiales bacterium]